MIAAHIFWAEEKEQYLVPTFLCGCLCGVWFCAIFWESKLRKYASGFLADCLRVFFKKCALMWKYVENLPGSCQGGSGRKLSWVRVRPKLSGANFPGGVRRGIAWINPYVCARLPPPPTLASRSIHDGFREFSKTAAISAFQKKITQCFTLNNSCLRGSCLSGRICRSPWRGAPCLLFAAGHAAISGGVCRFYRHFQEQKKGGHTVCVLITIP